MLSHAPKDSVFVFLLFLHLSFLPVALVSKRLEKSSAKSRKLWVGSQIPIRALPKNETISLLFTFYNLIYWLCGPIHLFFDL